MTKVEVIGPKELLLEVLELVRELGVFQMEPELPGFGAAGAEGGLRPFPLDRKTLEERLFLEELRRRIDELLDCLPAVAAEEMALDPGTVLDAVTASVQEQGTICRELSRRREELLREAEELGRHGRFLEPLAPLAAEVGGRTDLDFIGLQVRGPADLEEIMARLARVIGGKFEVISALAADGTIAALIALPREIGGAVRRILSEGRVPELSLPGSLAGLPFPERVRRLKERLDLLPAEIAAVEEELETLARRWTPLCRRVRRWLEERLSLLRATACVHATSLCFFIHGWVPAEAVAGLRKALDGRFGGRVVAEEREVLEQELERVPVALKNPPFLRPFELLVRLLPLPRYSSIDPTPFIGVFFPLFFGVMLGDAGHGLVVLLLSLAAARRFRGRRTIHDAARILVVSSAAAILFGILFGEFFGEFGAEHLGLHPLVVDRRTALMPMLFFSLSVGVMHVTLGLVLGAGAAFRRRTWREALFKLLTIAAILALVLLVVSLAAPQAPRLLARPAMAAFLAIIPLLIAAGGMMAPLELVKSIGNIISYARLMAIGLTSVFLAAVANRLAGMTGDIVLGILVGALFHAFNIVLGVFAPAIHSLRLHYVEFFSKFLEHGGRRYEPFRKS
uniref:ATPase n=1 Tax=Geobacter metallireducens TaxID=28232 RepID=A0A831UCD4_GEOME